MFQNGRLKMSTNTLLRNTGLVAILTAGMTLTACASGNNSLGSDHTDIFPYEGIGSTHSAVYTPPNYSAPTMPVSSGTIYTDCSVIDGMNCNSGHSSHSAPTYTQPTYSAPAYTPSYSSTATTSSYSGSTSGGTADCPSGTTAQADGTCLQSGGSVSYGSTSSYSSSSSYVGSTSSHGQAVKCPAGTTKQADGTCLQGSSMTYTPSYTSSSSSSSSSSYTSSSSSQGQAVACPSGTSKQPDGTCLENGGSSSSYTGYATPSHTPSTYLPIRK